MSEREQVNQNQPNRGKIEISDQVISNVVILTLAKQEGKEITQKSRDYKYYRKQVTIERPDDNSVAISVKVRIKYGEKIPEVTSQVQQAIKKEVESITGLKVVSVNVLVEDVIGLKSKDTNEEAEGKEDNKQ
ncbi:Asp23/Gls24 family envelope stress response protein [Athalassotoga saccharophila]|uniref:Asp23/Gls24 family envelope stress response protein n=1 Tax=Athalassotoga saccharophila TaxID=1441386 RepID=UPI00137B5DFE|nr:Asp23/Gls24 family envelope stress response protein [Athalassotoga saccharophila]BBJ28065.1 alkaline shock protein 23 [Athalassotoga saccharophila]